MKPAEFINKYVGTPFKFDGRDTTGVDCYGLVWLWYKEVNGVLLPDWNCEETTASWVRNFMTSCLPEHFEPIAAPRDGSIALARRKYFAHHVGIFFSNGIFHVMEGGSAAWKQRNIAEIEFGGCVEYGIPHVRP